MEKRTTKRMRKKRISMVFEWLLDGKFRHDICQLAANKWGLSHRQTDRYIHHANKVIDNLVAVDRSKRIARVEKQLMRQLAKANADGNGQLARSLLQDYIRLFGLNEPEEHNLNVREKLTPDERHRRLSKYFEFAADSRN